MNPNQIDPTNQVPVPPTNPTPEQPVAPQFSPQPQTQTFQQLPQQPVQQPVVAEEKYAKRLNIIGIVMIILGVLSALTFFADGQSAKSYFSLVLSIAQVFVGIGLLKHNKVAYIIFNVIAALAVLGGFFSLLGLAFFVTMLPALFAISALGATLMVIGWVLNIATSALCLFGIIWLHPKPVRQLLH